jgi:hypothetical protein
MPSAGTPSNGSTGLSTTSGTIASLLRRVGRESQTSSKKTPLIDRLTVPESSSLQTQDPGLGFWTITSRLSAKRVPPQSTRTDARRLVDRVSTRTLDPSQTLLDRLSPPGRELVRVCSTETDTRRLIDRLLTQTLHPCQTPLNRIVPLGKESAPLIERVGPLPTPTGAQIEPRNVVGDCTAKELSRVLARLTVEMTLPPRHRHPTAGAPAPTVRGPAWATQVAAIRNIRRSRNLVWFRNFSSSNLTGVNHPENSDTSTHTPAVSRWPRSIFLFIYV